MAFIGLLHLYFYLTFGALGLTSAARIISAVAGVSAGIGTSLYLFTRFLEELLNGNLLDAFTYSTAFIPTAIATIWAIIDTFGYLTRIAAKSFMASEQVSALTWPKMILISTGIASLVVSIIGLISDLDDSDTILFSKE